MLAERPKVEEAVRAVCAREGLTVRKLSAEHAGGKWALRYMSTMETEGNLELDVNFVFRIPLWPVVIHNSRQLGSYKAGSIPLLDIHELAAGKLAALLSRRTARDLFDTHLLLVRGNLNQERLSLAFVVYGAINRRDWRGVSVNDVTIKEKEIKHHLLPLLRKDFLTNIEQVSTFGRRLVNECRKALSSVLPLSETELRFLDRLLDHGEIVPSLLTADEVLAERIQHHPWLEWKALNVREHKRK